MAEWPFEEPDEQEDETAALFARVFRGGDGERVLARLRARSIDIAAPFGVSDSALWRLEGSRDIVRYIETLVNRGKGATHG